LGGYSVTNSSASTHDNTFSNGSTDSAPHGPSDSNHHANAAANADLYAQQTSNL
jgi:hypothetical protein